MHSKENVENIYPLTPVQEGILFHSMASGNSDYNNSTTFEIHDSLDIDLLEKSFYAVIRKHDILRAVITNELANRPLQIILKDPKPKFEFFDLSDIK